MNSELLKKAGVDYDKGVKRFVGRAQLYEKALSKFPKDGTFKRISAAYESKNSEELLASSHELKGMCGNIAITALYDAADAMVRMLRSGAFSEAELSAAYSLLKKEYNIAREAVIAASEVAL